MQTTSILESPIEFLKGIGPTKGELLKKELGVFTFRDLLMHFPFRYVDKTKFHKIKDLNEESETVQIRGVLRRLETAGEGRKKRLVGRFRDDTGIIELVWFKGANWLQKSLQIGGEYVAFGKINNFNGKINLPHPEMEAVTEAGIPKASSFAPVYPSTEKLNLRGLDAKGRRKIIKTLFEKIQSTDILENLPPYMLEKFNFPARFEAIKNIHFPKNQKDLDNATKRLKFEELFFLQLRLLQIRGRRRTTVKGIPFPAIGINSLLFIMKNYLLN